MSILICFIKVIPTLAGNKLFDGMPFVIKPIAVAFLEESSLAKHVKLFIVFLERFLRVSRVVEKNEHARLSIMFRD